MSSAYFDTSAIIKLVIAEIGSTKALQFWRAADRRVSSRLVRVEARAALAMAQRQGRLTAAQAQSARDVMNELSNRLTLIESDASVIEAAGDLAERLPLRGYDATHLASAMAAGVDVLVTADRDLIDCGRQLGLTVVDPTSP